MEVFNESLLSDVKHVSPLIVNDLKKTDAQLEKIKESMTPSRIVAQGYFKNLIANNMTEAGMNKAYDSMTRKVINNIIPRVHEDVDEVIKIFQTSGIVKRNETVPKEYYTVSFLGSKDNAIPEYVGIGIPVSFELDLKKMMQFEGFSESDVKDHFDDIKGYWNLLENSSNTEGLVQLLKKINDKEDSFYAKAKDYATTIAGKTLTRLFGVTALMCTSKGCKNIKYCPDPWISFCLNMSLLRIKDNAPNWEVEFKLTSWESAKSFDSCNAKYYMKITIYYKTVKKMFGCDFVRNGITY